MNRIVDGRTSTLRSYMDVEHELLPCISMRIQASVSIMPLVLEHFDRTAQRANFSMLAFCLL